MKTSKIILLVIALLLVFLSGAIFNHFYLSSILKEKNIEKSIDLDCKKTKCVPMRILYLMDCEKSVATGKDINWLARQSYEHKTLINCNESQ